MVSDRGAIDDLEDLWADQLVTLEESVTEMLDDMAIAGQHRSHFITSGRQQRFHPLLTARWRRAGHQLACGAAGSVR